MNQPLPTDAEISAGATKVRALLETMNEVLYGQEELIEAVVTANSVLVGRAAGSANAGGGPARIPGAGVQFGRGPRLGPPPHGRIDRVRS